MRTVFPAVCNMAERVLLTVQAQSEVRKNSSKEGGRDSQTTLRNKDAKAQEQGKGSKAGGGGWISRRVRGWWMSTINSHGIEISITGGVEERVPDLNLTPRGCSYIGVFPSTLTRHGSYSPVTRAMTHSES